MLERNLRLFPWFLVFTWEGLSNAVWYLYLYSYQGLNLEQMALLVMLGDGVIVLAEVPTGALADRIGRRRSMLAGVVAQAASMVLFIAGSQFWHFWLAMAVCGLGDTLRRGADQALLYDSCLALGQEQRFRGVLGHSLFIATIAMMAGQLIGGAIATMGYWHLPFWLEVGASAVGFAIVLRMVEPPRLTGSGDGPSPTLHISQQKQGLALAPQCEPQSQRPAAAATGRLLILPLLALGALMMLPSELSHFHLPAELAGAIHITPLSLAVLYAAFELLQGLGARIGGMERWRPLRALGLLALALVVAMAGLGAARLMSLTGAGLIVYLLCRGGVDFSFGMAEPLLAEEVNRRAESRVRATALSWLNAVSRGLPLLLLPLSAALAGRYGFGWMYLAFAAAAAPLIWAAWRWSMAPQRTQRAQS